MTTIYEPSANLRSRICRRLTVFTARKPMKVDPGRAIVSFSFDDCPVTGIENGVRVLEKENWLSTVYVSCGLFETENHLGKMMNGADALALHTSGHEIGEHSYSHQDAVTLGLNRFLSDVDRNQAELSELGLPPSETFAYPYGETFPKLKSAVSDRFKGTRGITKTVHRKEVDLNQIGSLPLFTDTIDDAVAAVKDLRRSGGWLTFFTHDVRDNPSAWGCTPETIQKIVTAVKDAGVEVLPIKDAITDIGGSA